MTPGMPSTKKMVETSTPATNKSKALELSMGKQSIKDSDVDGVLKFFEELPDDVSNLAGQSFYGLMNKTLMNKQK